MHASGPVQRQFCYLNCKGVVLFDILCRVANDTLLSTFSNKYTVPVPMNGKFKTNVLSMKKVVDYHYLH